MKGSVVPVGGFYEGSWKANMFLRVVGVLEVSLC